MTEDQHEAAWRIVFLYLDLAGIINNSDLLVPNLQFQMRVTIWLEHGMVNAYTIALKERGLSD